MKKKMISIGFAVAIILGIIWGIVIYCNSDKDEMTIKDEIIISKDDIIKAQNEMLAGIRHFELEYHSYYEYTVNYRNYDRVMKKYLTPVLTTVKEFNRDFPIDERHKGTGTVSVPHQSFNLKDDDKVWVYATYIDDYICDDILFVYDELSVTEENISIRAHFETIEQYASTAVNKKLIVISMIPVEQ